MPTSFLVFTQNPTKILQSFPLYCNTAFTAIIIFNVIKCTMKEKFRPHLSLYLVCFMEDDHQEQDQVDDEHCGDVDDGVVGGHLYVLVQLPLILV
mgnify:CR=1 FL=1